MAFLNTVHKKKSAVITLITAFLIALLFFGLGLRYLDPPISYGMEVNFGTSNVGIGELQPQKPIASKPIPVNDQKETTSKTDEAIAKPKIDEQAPVITNKESTVVVNDKKETKKTPSFQEPIKEVKKPKPKPKVSEATKKVLSNFINNKPKTGEQKGGAGDDILSGDKGKLDGNPYATSYYDNAGLGGKAKGFGLNGRNLMSNGSKVQECNQEGTVVVRITVNQDGRVILAEPGVKGTTNIHPCLLAPAKATALLHRWYPDADAPQKQIGFVVIQFKLGE